MRLLRRSQRAPREACDDHHRRPSKTQLAAQCEVHGSLAPRSHPAPRSLERSRTALSPTALAKYSLAPRLLPTSETRAHTAAPLQARRCTPFHAPLAAARLAAARSRARRASPRPAQPLPLARLASPLPRIAPAVSSRPSSSASTTSHPAPARRRHYPLSTRARTPPPPAGHRRHAARSRQAGEGSSCHASRAQQS